MNGREIVVGVAGGVAAYKTAFLVSRLAQAGAILLGKLNLSELAMGGTRNPPRALTTNDSLWDYLGKHAPGFDIELIEIL